VRVVCGYTVSTSCQEVDQIYGHIIKDGGSVSLKSSVTPTTDTETWRPTWRRV
jgi:hypothetical protein